MVQPASELNQTIGDDHFMPAIASQWSHREKRYAPTTDFHRRVYCLLGLPIDAISMDAAVERIVNCAAIGQRCFFSTPNLNYLINAQKDKAFRESVVHSDLSLADGMPLVWIARATGIPIKERVAGSNLFEELRKKSRKPLSVYFFGGSEGVAADASNRLNTQLSALVGVGAQYPGFGSVEEMSKNSVIDQINSSSADFLVVSVGSKKAQAWIENNLIRLNVPVVSHLGAVINFVAGSVRRAPVWMQRSGFEWIWRIKEEPSLWKRYFFDGLGLSRLVLTHVLPCVMCKHLLPPSAEQVSEARCEAKHHRNLCNIRLTGAWVENNLGPLRDAFAEATSTPTNIRIDFYHVSYIDAACAGLLTLLYGHQSQTGRGFKIVSVSKKIERFLKLYGAEYVLDRFSNA